MTFGPSEITFGLRKGWKLCNVITYNVMWANQKTELVVFCWLCTYAMLDYWAFLKLSEHRTSFQVFCQYVKCTE